jgi:hypothetical protein
LQNVRRLVLGYDHAHAFTDLLNATSLPGVEEVWLRKDMRSFEAFNSGADLYFGPWAAQLVTVGASFARHLEVLSERIEDLPALEHLALLFAYVQKRERMAPIIKALPGLLPHIKRLSLCMTGHISEYPYYDGIGEVLDAISEHNLETLDLRACAQTRLEGEVGESFVQKHFIDNGLASRLGTLCVHEHISPELCDMLRAQGVDVQVPAKVELKAKAPAFDYIKEVPSGERERCANHEVHVHDAMMFDEPCKEAWQVLIGVVNGLEVQLSGEDFARACATLNEHLTQWPDVYRELPPEWYKALYDEEPSPKLDLVRRLHLNINYQSISTDMKCVSRWITHLSRAPHVGKLSMLDVLGYGGQKHLHEAILALVQAMRPSSFGFSTLDRHRDKLCVLLDQHGVLPELREHDYTPRKKSTPHTSTNAYTARHVTHRVTTLDEFYHVLALRELGHVVSLNIELYGHAEFSAAPDVSPLKVEPANFDSLRFLSVSVPGNTPAMLGDVLLTWLQRARPVCIGNGFNTTSSLIEAGLYGRAFGSTINLSNSLTAEEISACVGHEHLHVSRIGFRGAMSGEMPGVSELIQSMHAGLRSSVRILEWATEISEWPELDGACAQLPNLSMLSLFNPAFMSAESRAPYLHAFKQMTHLHTLSYVRVLADTSRKHAPFAAKEIKSLYKVSHAAAEVLCIQGKP